MESVKYIFGEPEEVSGIKIHPIQMKHYDEFMEIANILTVSYDSFSNEDGSLDDIKLLDLVLLLYVQLGQGELVVDSFEKLFSFVCKQTIKYDGDSFKGETVKIDSGNYDNVRNVILKQNLIFEPKIYKNKLMQEWAELALKARAKSSLKYTVEDMITTIVAFNGMDINILFNYSIYQIKAIFQRVLKIKNYDTTILFKSVGSDASIDHFAEEINMFVNPYDGIIKEDTQRIDKTINGSLSKP